jgi:Helix-turn-helix domain
MVPGQDNWTGKQTEQIRNGSVPDVGGQKNLMCESSDSRVPLLSEILTIKGLLLRPTYTTRQAAEEVFGVSPRALQNWIAEGKLVARDLPGRARFFPGDLEDFLRNSRGGPK